MNRVRLWLWLLVGLAAAGFALLLWRQPAPNAVPPPQVTLSRVDFGGPFTLIGADGQPFASNRLAGRPYAIFFGFTHCPDVCPTTLARMVRLRRELGRDFEIVFVTVDPERDGPAEVGQYTQLFGERVVGLTGSPAQIAQVKRRYGIHSAKVPDGSGGYSVDHTATVLLFDKAGTFVATIAPEENDSAALAKLRRVAA